MPETTRAPYVYRRPDDTIVTASGATITERDRARLHNQRRRARAFARTDEELAADQRRLMPDGHATCVECGQRLPISAFVVSRHRPRGIRNFCVPCRDQHLATAAQNARLAQLPPCR
jgi:hypothetical protein